MPYIIVHDGEQFCVHKKTPDGSAGKRIACHDSRGKAQASIAAMYASENKSLVMVYREGGRRYMVLLSSNAYRDREEEIVAQKALENYVANFDGEQPFLFWHGGEPIGDIVEARMFGPFLMELVQEPPDHKVNVARAGEAPYPVSTRELWDAIEKSDEVWGASIGFKYIEGDEKDGVYEKILKLETSILPRAAAANVVTAAVVIKGD